MSETTQAKGGGGGASNKPSPVKSVCNSNPFKNIEIFFVIV